MSSFIVAKMASRSPPQPLGTPEGDRRPSAGGLWRLTTISLRVEHEEALRRTQLELAHVTRLMAMGEMVSTITHEVNQPLCAIVTNSNACSGGCGRYRQIWSGRKGHCGALLRNGDRSDVIALFRGFVKKTDGQVESLQSQISLKIFCSVTAYDTQRTERVVEQVFSPDIPNNAGNPVQLQEVVLNLVMNAVDAIRETTRRPCRLTIHVELPRRHPCVVQDSNGISPENVERIFDTFFTTKKNGYGDGTANLPFDHPQSLG